MKQVTVGELKEMLDFFSDNTVVMVGRNSGDYWRRILADNIADEPETKLVKWSDYHGTYVQPDEPDDDCFEVLVIGTQNFEQYY